MLSDSRQFGGSSVAFPEDHLTPFPETADFFYGHLIPPPVIDNQPPHFPPQKLRPIRRNARSLMHDHYNSFDSFVQSINGCTSPELGFMSPSQLPFPDCQLHSPSPEAGDADCFLPALRQIIPVEGFNCTVSELKKQIPPLDSTSSSSEDIGVSSDPADGKFNPSFKKKHRKKRKRMESFLEDLMMQVINKQEQMHKQLMEVIEKREADQIVREEAWRRQEIQLANKGEAIRAQEASRSLALITFIQNVMSGSEIQLPQPLKSLNSEEECGEIRSQSYSSNRKWPKSEVQALIALRCAFDIRFRDVSSKDSLWEDISFRLAKMGYRRSARKCEEKWLNINKYYKSAFKNGKTHVKNANRVPYFQELEILYRNGFIR